MPVSLLPVVWQREDRQFRGMSCAAQVVPSKVRTSVYAFDKCVAGLLGALASPLVGILAKRCFGYSTPAHSVSACNAAPIDVLAVLLDRCPTKGMGLLTTAGRRRPSRYDPGTCGAKC